LDTVTRTLRGGGRGASLTLSAFGGGTLLGTGAAWQILVAALLALLHSPGSAFGLNLLHELGTLGCRECNPVNRARLQEIADAACIVSAKL
jgi:hypothetical protein